MNNPVTVLIVRFGGMSTLLKAMGERPHTNIVRGWQKKGRIPHFRRHQIIAAADQKRLRLDDALLAQLFVREAA